MAIRPRHRRGALLLVCLVLLVLFLLLGITFVLTAGSFRKSTRATMRAKQFDQPLDTVNVLDTVLMEFLRGSSNSRSPFNSQNLLGDLYGEPSLKGRVVLDTDADNNGIDDNVYSGGGQFMHLVIKVDAGFALRNVPGYYEGQVLSVVSGAAAGQSRRIVDYQPGTTTAEFVVMAFDEPPNANSRVVVNGRAFSGTGNGYLPLHPTGQTPDNIIVESGGSFDPNDPKYAGTGGYKAFHALYPNSTYFEPTRGVPVDGDTEYLTPTGLGGQNEDYDAADSNNPWLAIVTSRGIKPSFHDPALLQHWLGWASLQTEIDGSAPADQIKYNIDHPRFEQIYRRTSFRPIRGDHPAFTGSNPDYVTDVDDPFNDDFANDPTTAYEWWRDGPWDVDNDGDGIPDSIWIDIGLPVQTLKDGRVVKPLAAMLVRDMDGRVNINTSGTLALADAATMVTDARLAGGVGSAAFPRGSGYGPAEIDLRWVLTEFNDDGTLDTTASDADVRQLLEDLLLGSNIAGVNNDESFFGRYTASNTEIGGSAAPGKAGVNDLAGRLLATQWWGALGAFTARPHDLLGLGVVGVDYRGNPLRGFMGGPTDTALFVDDPYEMYLGDLALSNFDDKPFSYEELERVMRALDVDNSTLERRLLSLGGGLLVRNRDLITTESESMPVYSAGVSFNADKDKSLRERLRLAHEADPSVPVYPQHITDVFLARILQEGGSSNDVNTLVNANCIAPEMMAGLRFDVNRLFGNGQDDNGNGIVDEPAEAGLETLYSSSLASAASAGMTQAAASRKDAFTDVPVDLNHDGELQDNNDPDRAEKLRDFLAAGRDSDFAARQDYARQLYCLLMVVADREGAIATYRDSVTGGGGGGNQDLIEQEALNIFARRIAQFAVNVVDFRDPDAIMTPFHYDPNPFDGWNPPAPTLLQNTIVWGCELPVAMLSESLALDNQRLVDGKKDASKTLLDSDPSGDMDDGNFRLRQKQDDAGNEMEYDLAGQDDWPDQAGIPIASLFFEIQCTAGADRSYYPPELFTNDGKLDLARMDDNGNGNRPVWRMMIAEPHVNVSESKYNESDSVVGILRDLKKRDRFSLYSNNQPATPIASVLPGIDQDGNGMTDEIAIRAAREVWFTTSGTPSHTRFINRYASQNSGADDPNTKLAPGEYVVVGPREYTVISQDSDAASKERQLIHLDPGDDMHDPDIYVTQANGDSDYPTLQQVKRPKAIVCQAAPPAGWTADYARGLTGLNISAPRGDNFYPHRFKVADGDERTPQPASVKHEDIDGDGEEEDVPDGYTTMLEFMVDGDTVEAPLAVPFYKARTESDRFKEEYSAADGSNDVDGSDYPIAILNAVKDEDNKPLFEGADTTVPNYSTAFLQRLANPLMPFDDVYNPYVTVDWITIDLTIYGRDESMNGKPKVNSPPGDRAVALRSRERGLAYRYAADPDRYSRNLWRQAMKKKLADNPGGSGNSGFNHDLVHSFGFLNRTMIATEDQSDPDEQYVDVQNVPANTWFSTAAGREGEPVTPAPWIVWNDGPFVSQYELMQVPASAPGMLGFEFSDGYTAELNLDDFKISDSRVVNNPYGAFVSSADLDGPSIAFNHLLNFFNCTSSSIGGSLGEGVQLGAVFDYLRVPSLYANSNTVLNPKDFVGQEGHDFRNDSASTLFNDKLEFRPPFNVVSNYREPGRINLNTIYDPRVWWALMHGRKIPDHNGDPAYRHPALRGTPADSDRGAFLDPQRHPGPSWEDFVQHRRGYGAGPGWNIYDTLALQGRRDPNLTNYYPYTSPTYIAMPYRSQTDWDLNPFIGIAQHESQPADPTYIAADATLLRRQIENADMTILDPATDQPDPGRAKYPLFREPVRNKVTSAYLEDPDAPAENYRPNDDKNLDLGAVPRPYQDPARDSYFKYQPINRLGNLTTTQSNVYSIWITVGYFEVTTAPAWKDSDPPTINDFVYPDGYQLGREVGEETGEITRHRAFYIVDRSIPVAYENGQDYNVENVIKLRRKIE